MSKDAAHAEMKCAYLANGSTKNLSDTEFASFVDRVCEYAVELGIDTQTHTSMKYQQYICAGNVVADLENKGKDKPLVIGTIATCSPWYSDKEDSFIEFKAFGKTAETLAANVRKGDSIMLIGGIKQERWLDKSGAKRSKLIMLVDRMVFGDRRRSDAPAKPASEDLPW